MNHLLEAFSEEMAKIASDKWHAAAEIAGLGTLAAPTIAKKLGKPMSDKNKDRAELGGLGILAAPAAHTLWSAAKAVKKV